MTKITNVDRGFICRDGWARAYSAAILAVEPVRAHIGNGLREAWSEFRKARAEGRVVERQTAAYEEKYGRSDRREARTYLKGLLAARAATDALLHSCLDAGAVMRRVLVKRIASNDAAMVNMRQEIDCEVAISGLAGVIDPNYDEINDLYRDGCALREDLRDLDSGGVGLPASEQHDDALKDGRSRVRRALDLGITQKIEQLLPLAQAWCDKSNEPDSLRAAVSLERLWKDREKVRAQIRAAETAGPARSPAPVQIDLVEWLAARPLLTEQQSQQPQVNAGFMEADLSTSEGLAEVLVGRTAKLCLHTGHVTYTVTSVNRWKSCDEKRVKDFIHLESNCMWAETHMGPIELYIERLGAGRTPTLETKVGLAHYRYGMTCNSNEKQCRADDLVRDILKPIMD